jgi:hypothetical protein
MGCRIRSRRKGQQLPRKKYIIDSSQKCDKKKVVVMRTVVFKEVTSG